MPSEGRKNLRSVFLKQDLWNHRKKVTARGEAVHQNAIEKERSKAGRIFHRRVTPLVMSQTVNKNLRETRAKFQVVVKRGGKGKRETTKRKLEVRGRVGRQN